MTDASPHPPPGGPVLTRILRDGAGAAARLDLRDWDLLIRQARFAGLEPRLEAMVRDAGLIDAVPRQPAAHLAAARIFSERHNAAVAWEIECIGKVAEEYAIPFVLLKGAAYVAAGLPPGRSRLFTDIDLMVPQVALRRTEGALAYHGWFPTRMSAYDQRYYREWMHEVPPLKHARRRTVVDLHHTILPPTARARPDARRLLADAVPVPGQDGVFVLSPPDMVLHCATHLFYDGEFHHGLRDLVDLDDLVRHFAAQDAGFWTRLVDRAFEMDLARPLHYGLRYARRTLGTPVPPEPTRALARAGPNALMQPVMDALFGRALRPPHPSCADALTPTARWLLYVRGHYLRMPMRLLVPHLARKAVARAQGEDAE